MTATPGKKAVDLPAVASVHAAIMFGTGLVFLAVLAIVVQWWNSSKILEHDSQFTARLMLLLWMPFLVESLAGFVLHPGLGGNARRFFLLVALPPFRLGYSTFFESGTVWLPGLGWRRKGRALFEELDRRATIPMLIIALMILPLLGVEFLLKDKVAELPWLSVSLDVCAAFIWFAFAFEFIVMVSVAEDKIAYCKKNWLNLLIILLPLIAFLRGLQVVRAFRVARAGKLLRVYRMRSLLLRIYQALVAISAIERLIYRNPEKHLEKLEKAHKEKERELAELRAKIASVRERVAEFRDARAADEGGD
ncbi:MAG: hypothetical protein DWQ08_15100 [Proteobacteria bacterium]|nr:MAG: hypothetical protein DWQ08_15100 [Pseudomonadota bacterium]